MPNSLYQAIMKRPASALLLQKRRGEQKEEKEEEKEEEKDQEKKAEQAQEEDPEQEEGEEEKGEEEEEEEEVTGEEEEEEEENDDDNRAEAKEQARGLQQGDDVDMEQDSKKAKEQDDMRRKPSKEKKKDEEMMKGKKGQGKVKVSVGTSKVKSQDESLKRKRSPISEGSEVECVTFNQAKTGKNIRVYLLAKFPDGQKTQLIQVSMKESKKYYAIGEGIGKGSSRHDLQGHHLPEAQVLGMSEETWHVGLGACKEKLRGNTQDLNKPAVMIPIYTCTTSFQSIFCQ